MLLLVSLFCPRIVLLTRADCFHGFQERYWPRFGMSLAGGLAVVSSDRGCGRGAVSYSGGGASGVGCGSCARRPPGSTG